MGKTIRKQFGIKFIEGNRKAHKKLKYICRCEYCMGLRKRKLQIKEKLKEIQTYNSVGQSTPLIRDKSQVRVPDRVQNNNAGTLALIEYTS